MVSVRDDDPSILRIPYQEKRRQCLPRLDLVLVPCEMSIADPQQGQAGRPEDILRFEL